MSSLKALLSLHAGDEALEALDEARVVRRLLGERAGLERVLGDEHRLDELGLDALTEQLVDLGPPGRRERHGLVEPLRLDGGLEIGHGARVVGADVDAGLVLDGLAHGEARPGRGQVDIVIAKPHAEVADGASRRGGHLFDHRHHVVVVHVGLVGLEHRELGIVLEAHALVAEVLAHLVDAVDAADDAALEVQLGGDAQVQVTLELVVMGDERPRQGAAVERLQHGRLDLDETAPVEKLADGANDAGALHEHLARVVVDHEVEVARR